MDQAAAQSPGNLAAIEKPAMIRIPEGWFWMGCETGLDCERPRHRVWVDSFELASCQVTNLEYSRYLEATGATPPPYFNHPDFSRPRQPIVAVSWFEAVAYCDWLTRQTGHLYRLPTEAEWERAARAGVDDQLYPWGDEPPQSLPGYASRWQTGPEPVGGDQPNAYGLSDMCANVHEWCSDWFDPLYYQHCPERNPQGPAEGTRRASRGGSWRHHIKNSRCHTRSSIPPQFQYADYGFRLARSS